MITGILLRNYKNYANIKFIPVSDDTNHPYTIFIGENGVGKSAILEALDVVFNDRIWNTTHGTKRNEAFICPIFLLEKNKFESNRYRRTLDELSNIFWNEKMPREYADFTTFREKIKRYSSDYYLIIVGAQYNTPKDAYFSSALDSKIKDKFTEKNILNQVKSTIFSLYTYLYVSTEDSPVELLKLQHRTMQRLLNKNLLREIDSMLNAQTQGRQSIVKQINIHLDDFINEVNKVISKIDTDYKFKNEEKSKGKLTARDIREKILETFFPLRLLKLKSYSVGQLSSGEQRKALVDIAYSILEANKSKMLEKSIIFAIDEPENSLDATKRFEQFIRLEKLVDFGTQLLITTHWYGSIPISKHGNLHCLTTKNALENTIDTFDISNVFEKKHSKKYIIFLKSWFDLATSIVACAKKQPKISWIICEGSDDKLYLEQILHDNIEKIRIIPVSGCSNVAKLYNILAYAFDDIDKRTKIAKIICLIDTDKKFTAHDFQTPNTANLFFKRLQISEGAENLSIELVDVATNGQTYSQTEIEDCLDPSTYFNAVKNCIKHTTDKKLIDIIEKCHLDTSATVSVLHGDNACYTGDISRAEKKQIITFAENDINKIEIAQEYTKLCNTQQISHVLSDKIMQILNS